MLSIVAVAISLFFIIGVALLISLLILVRKVRKVAAKAEDAIDSVEAASEAIKNIGSEATGPLAAFKIIKSIVDMVNRKK